MKTALLRATRSTALWAAGVLVAVAAQAQTVTITSNNNGPLATGSEPVKVGSTAESPLMGEFTITDSSSKNYDVYCLDPLRVFTNQVFTTMSLSSFLSTTNLAGSGTLTNYQKEFTASNYTNAGLTQGAGGTVWGTQSSANANALMNNMMALYSHAFSDGLKDAVHSQAFQYAAWEVLLDQAGSYNTGANNMQIASGANSTFSTISAGYLAALNSGNWASAYNIGSGLVNLSATANYNYTVFVPSTANGQIVMMVNGVPEPGALSLAALALVGLGYTRHRATRRL